MMEHTMGSMFTLKDLRPALEVFDLTCRQVQFLVEKERVRPEFFGCGRIFYSEENLLDIYLLLVVFKVIRFPERSVIASKWSQSGPERFRAACDEITIEINRQDVSNGYVKFRGMVGA
jgi:hypothetical protein